MWGVVVAAQGVCVGNCKGQCVVGYVCVWKVCAGTARQGKCKSSKSNQPNAKVAAHVSPGTNWQGRAHR